LAIRGILDSNYDFSTVAFTGDYNDLTNKPTVTNGTNGKSAYQSYVDTTSDNPVLTEVQWVASLQGTNGTNGTNGINGITPSIDSISKHWMIGSTDTGVVAEG
jgi:hypothetical protein